MIRVKIYATPGTAALDLPVHEVIVPDGWTDGEADFGGKPLYLQRIKVEIVGKPAAEPTASATTSKPATTCPPDPRGICTHCGRSSLTIHFDGKGCTSYDSADGWADVCETCLLAAVATLLEARNGATHG